MMNKYKKLIIVAIVCGMTVGTMVHACMVTFYNNTSGRVAILNELDGTFMFLSKNIKRRFGDYHKQAKFTVYIQQPKKNIEVWTPLYTCKQYACSSKGNTVLKYSDVQNGVDANNVFTIIKHEPYSSMVGKLTMIQKNDCHSCKN